MRRLADPVSGSCLFFAARAEALMTTQNTAHDDAGIVEVDGAQLRYPIEGHGPPCLMVGNQRPQPPGILAAVARAPATDLAGLRDSADPRHPASEIRRSGPNRSSSIPTPATSSRSGRHWGLLLDVGRRAARHADRGSSVRRVVQHQPAGTIGAIDGRSRSTMAQLQFWLQSTHAH